MWFTSIPNASRIVRIVSAAPPLGSVELIFSWPKPGTSTSRSRGIER